MRFGFETKKRRPRARGARGRGAEAVGAQQNGGRGVRAFGNDIVERRTKIWGALPPPHEGEREPENGKTNDIMEKRGDRTRTQSHTYTYPPSKGPGGWGPRGDDTRCGGVHISSGGWGAGCEGARRKAQKLEVSAPDHLGGKKSNIDVLVPPERDENNDQKRREGG